MMTSLHISNIQYFIIDIGFSIYSYYRIQYISRSIVIYFLWQCDSFLFRRSGLSCALMDNTSSVLKEKVPKHRGCYVIHHKWYCQALLSACSLRIILFASLQHMAESDASYKQSARRACNKSNGKWKWVLQKSRYNLSRFLSRPDAKALSGIENPWTT